MRKKLLTIILMLLPVIGWGQAKIYTKKARMEDFQVKTTKVVLPGESLLALRVKDEIQSRWHVSPFEFCTPEEYQGMSNDSGHYFLLMGSADGVVFLSLRKGGKEEDADRFKRPFEVVSIPIAAEGMSSGQEIGFMGAFVDLIQRVALDAMESDIIGYNGLIQYNFKKMEGKRILLSPSAADSAMFAEEENSLAGIVVSPASPGKDRWFYRMLISCDTHELFFYERQRFTEGTVAAFSEKNVSQFEKRHGIVTR